MPTTLFLVCFLSLKDSTHKTEKNVFYFTSEAVFILVKIKFLKILGIQYSWYHQMPKHEARNTYYWITLEVNTICWWSLVCLCHIAKENFLLKSCTKIAIWKQMWCSGIWCIKSTFKQYYSSVYGACFFLQSNSIWPGFIFSKLFPLLFHLSFRLSLPFLFLFLFLRFLFLPPFQFCY